MRLPIRLKLTLWFAGLLASIIVCLGAFLVLQLRSDLRLAIDDEARASSGQLLNVLADERREDDDEPADADESASDFVQAAWATVPLSGGAQVLDARGKVLARYGDVAGRAPLVDRRTQRAALAGLVPTLTIPAGDGEGQRYRATATAFADGGQVHILVLALSLQPVDEAVHKVLLLLLIAGPVAVTCIALAAYWLARQALRPVERMTSDAREIGAGRLHERVAVPPGGDEIGRLGLTLNAMLDRIEQGVTNKHRLVADASHELRTPLAVMRAEIDVSLRGDELPISAREVLESAREEVDRMTRTVDNLLALAEADEGKLELLTVPVSLREAIEESARPLRLLAVANDVTLLSEGGPLVALADRQRLHLALTNLIENAIKFSPSGGTVRVTSWRRGTEVGVTVIDEGPGIPAADLERLFDRFYRADRGRDVGGSGLGLAIASEVAVAHGGRLWAESKLGGGSTFFLALPSWRAVPTGDDRLVTARERP